MMDSQAVERVKAKFDALRGVMTERQRRLWAASEAQALGWGGTAAVAKASGLSRTTIRQGMQELERPGSEALRQRRCGGGRRPVDEQDRQLRQDLEALIEPTSRGDPQSPLRWTTLSSRHLAQALAEAGHAVSHATVTRLLHDMDYSLQANRKNWEGLSDPDRDRQFAHINAQVQAFQARGQPVVSVDTKKKELVGEFYQKGRQWQPQGQPESVHMHDFPDPDLGKAIPYGVYDLKRNEGWVSVGIDHDTADFAVETLRRWWMSMGVGVYPNATELLVTADAGGSNGYKNRLWKVNLQRFADEFGLQVHVCHFPPGTSKWNKIEHRLFSHITQNWRARPLISQAVIVNPEFDSSEAHFRLDSSNGAG